MKVIQQNIQDNSEWSSKLLDNLEFVKQRLRYPLSWKIFFPVLILSASLLGATYFVVRILSHHPRNGVFALLLIVVLVALPTFIRAWRYIASLKFLSMDTGYDVVKNQELLKQFLESQQLVVFRHPDVPEIFQIVSKNIDAFGDQREVLIFIADDKRILLNSHFSYTSKWRMYDGNRHHQEMKNMLERWIANKCSSMEKPLREIK